MTVKQNKISALEIARSLAILGVVFIHSSSLFLAEHANADLKRILFATRFAVPLFIMLSGYLHKKRPDAVSRRIHYKKFVTRRFERIIIPYLAFSAFYMAIRVFIERVQPLDAFVQTKFDSLERIISAIFLVKDNPAGHLYFLPLLFFVIILYCLASEIIKNGHSVLIVCIAASMSAYIIDGNIYLSLNPVKGIGFYAFGHYVRLRLHAVAAIRTTLGLFVLSMLGYMLVLISADKIGSQLPPYRLAILFIYHLTSAYFALQLSFYASEIKSFHLPTSAMKFIGKYSYTIFLWHEPYIVSVLYIILIRLSVTQPVLNQSFLILAGLFLPIIWYRYFLAPVKRFVGNLSIFEPAT